MVEDNQVPFDAPIPGESLTAELGSRPWQSPPQFATVEQALDYYLPRLQSDEVAEQLVDVLEMGIPVTTVANSMQLGAVMDGKLSVDVGILILTVLIELIFLIGYSAGVKYTSGLEKETEMRSSLIDLAISRFKETEDKEETETEEVADIEEPKGGLMSRRMQQ